MNKHIDEVAYQIGNVLYLNVTNRCTSACDFCVRSKADGVGGHHLWLSHEPSVEEVLRDVSRLEREQGANGFSEYVFCGYGEPLMRLDLVKAVAQELKARGCRVRVNTNGHANLVHGRNVSVELAGLVDTVSISLNAENPYLYDEMVHSAYGPDAFGAMVYFAEQCKRYLMKVVLTVVELPGVDLEACRKIAAGIGAEFRARRFIE